MNYHDYPNILRRLPADSINLWALAARYDDSHPVYSTMENHDHHQLDQVHWTPFEDEIQTMFESGLVVG